MNVCKRYRRPRVGFTVVEMVIATLVIGICILLIVVPADVANGSEADAAGRLFASMVEYAQSMAMARPDQTFVIKADQARNRFWVANAALPDTPLTHPITRQPYLVQLGSGSPDGLTAISIASIAFGGDDTLVFDSTGSIDQASAAVIAFGAGSGRAYAGVSPTTGLTCIAPTLDLAISGGKPIVVGKTVLVVSP